MEYTDIEKKRFEELPSDTHRKVYTYLRGLGTTGKKNEAFPKVKTIAGKMGMSPSHISHNILPDLREMGLILTKRVGKINHYEFPLMYGEILPEPPQEEIEGQKCIEKDEKERKKYSALTREEKIQLFVALKRGLNGGSQKLKENLLNALDRYIKELSTPKQEVKPSYEELDCQDPIEDFPSDIEHFPSANENTENTPQPTLVPTQQRKGVIPEKVDRRLEVSALVDDNETFKRKCINNGLYNFRNNIEQASSAKYLYDRLIKDAWSTMEEVQEKAPDVYSYWNNLQKDGITQNN